MPGGMSVVEPPESMPNSEVKRNSADDSVGFPHVKVGHCQAPLQSPVDDWAFFMPAVLRPHSRHKLHRPFW